MTAGWAATNTLREYVAPEPRDGPVREALALVEAALDANTKALDAYYQFAPHMSYCALGPNNDPPCDCGRDALDALYEDSAAALPAVREGK